MSMNCWFRSKRTRHAERLHRESAFELNGLALNMNPKHESRAGAQYRQVPSLSVPCAANQSAIPRSQTLRDCVADPHPYLSLGPYDKRAIVPARYKRSGA